jgi:Na+/H+ antiporter NhaD/arsenite permease-like protein
METLIVVVFVLGYLGIAFEHVLKVNKAAIALLTGIVCWVLYVFTGSSDTEVHHINNHLLEHFGRTSEILFFLLGAMTIVELIDAHQGFTAITDLIKTTNKKKLLWILSFMTFFLSAILDNLTTTIVMVSLLRKIIADRNERLPFVGLVIIAANAGGAWSPIGDVTTTMLWNSGRITSGHIIPELILPSLICMIIHGERGFSCTIGE